MVSALGIVVLAQIFPGRAMAQQDALASTPPVTRRAARAVQVTGAAPRIDGVLDETIWHRAFADSTSHMSDFIGQAPVPGARPSLPTVAALAYDRDAIYVAVRAFDSAPDSIVAPYPRRDNETRSDWIFVEIDTRHDRRTAQSFGVNPRGVQVDGTWTNDNIYDTAWNGVWNAAARVDSAGWTVEIRIPFSQLRVAPPAGDNTLATWGINIYRYIPRRGEVSNWSPRLPTFTGVVSHFNEVAGVMIPRGTHPFELRPFSLLRSEPSSSLAVGAPSLRRSTSSAVGADATVRIGFGLTLNGAIRPDFGQVEADPSQINLTTFETFLAERRPFFTNAADVFAYPLGLTFRTRGDDFGSEQAFYSRRIGAPPHGDAPSTAVAAQTPSSTGVTAAAEISGRTDAGWTVGALSVRTDVEQARYLDSAGHAHALDVEPATYFSAIRLARDFHNNTRSLGVFATFVDRAPSAPSLDSLLVHQAAFVGIDGRDRFGHGQYELNALLGASRLDGSAPAITRVLTGAGHYLQRTRYSARDSAALTTSGGLARLSMARIGGALTWSVTGYGTTPRFDVNAAGFQRNADWLLGVATVQYQRTLPRGALFRRWSVGSDEIGLGWSTRGERRTTVVNARANGDLWTYWGGSVSVDHELAAASTDLLRGGPAVIAPARTTARLALYTDTRRTMRGQLNATLMSESRGGSALVDVAPVVTAQVGDHLTLTGGVDASTSTQAWQYLTPVTDPSGGSDYLLARLRQRTASLTARLDYAFSPHVIIQTYFQPYLGSGQFDRLSLASGQTRYAEIDQLGPTRVQTSPSGWLVNVDGSNPITVASPNFTARELHGSAVLRWEYRPGSDVYIVWTQTRTGTADDGPLSVSRDATALFRLRPQNVLLVKASYYWVP